VRFGDYILSFAVPPKKAASATKTVQKAKKTAEDKTFGMKNKNKSKKVQQYISSVETAARANADRAVRGAPTRTYTCALGRMEAVLEADSMRAM
jgi:hypothetical protein